MSKKLISWVLPGREETIAISFFLPDNIFIREDFPTLDRPTKANSGKLGAGHLSSLAALVSNSAEWICMSAD